MLILVAAALAAGAEPKLSRFTFSEAHMGTKFTQILYAPDEATAKAAAKDAFSRVADLNRIMSDYSDASELNRLCEKAGSGPVRVSAELFFVLARAGKVSEESAGAFDVTVRPVVTLWRQARRTREMPEAEKLKAALALVGWKNVVLDEKARTVELKAKGMRLDLGGIGKGFAADEMHRVLRKHGVTRALVAAGGDITVTDPPPGKTGWRVEIQAVDADKEGARFMDLANASVSTSGDAEQYVEIGGRRYSHIVDPRTGLGLPGRMSATVVAPDGITADSLTKVVAILGPEKGFEVIGKYKGVSGRYVLKTDKGTEVKAGKGFPKLSR